MCLVCPRGNGQYLQVDLRRDFIVTGIATQGFKALSDYYVRRYKISRSRNGHTWSIFPVSINLTELVKSITITVTMIILTVIFIVMLITTTTTTISPLKLKFKILMIIDERRRNQSWLFQTIPLQPCASGYLHAATYHENDANVPFYSMISTFRSCFTKLMSLICH